MISTSVSQWQVKEKHDNSWIYFSFKQVRFLVRIYLQGFLEHPSTFINYQALLFKHAEGKFIWNWWELQVLNTYDQEIKWIKPALNKLSSLDSPNLWRSLKAESESKFYK